MMTLRQIERLWTAKSYRKLYQELVSARHEAAFRLESELATLPAVSALAMIRLDELSQSYLPFYNRLLRTILSAQEADGGWGDLAVTALCIRALMCGQGQGVAVERGLAYLANLQKLEGIWPAVPIRRMPEDACVSLFILCQLGENARFREGVRFHDAVAWFERHESGFGHECRELWKWVRLRCRTHAAAAPEPTLFAAA